MPWAIGPLQLVKASGHQVWSLAKFCSLHDQGSVKKSAFSTNAISRFASDVFDGVRGSLPSVAHLTVSLIICGSRGHKPEVLVGQF